MNPGTPPPSALVPPEAFQRRRRRLGLRAEFDQLRQVVLVLSRSLDLACGSQPLHGTAVGKGRQERHRPAPIGDLNRLTLLDKAKKLACSLPKRPYTDRSHKLLVAHQVLPRTGTLTTGDQGDPRPEEARGAQEGGPTRRICEGLTLHPHVRGCSEAQRSARLRVHVAPLPGGRLPRASGYLSRPATALMVTPTMQTPKRYDSRAWRRAVARIAGDVRSVSDTWNVIPRVRDR